MNKQQWFKKAGWFYLPIHAVGILVTLIAIIIAVTVGMAALANSKVDPGRGYEIFAYTTCIAFWWKWIAEKTAG